MPRPIEAPVEATFFQAPYPGGWVVRNGDDLHFHAAEEGFPGGANAGAGKDLCVIDCGAETSRCFQAALGLRRANAEIPVIVLVSPGSLPPADLRSAGDNRIFVMDRGCDPALLDSTIRGLLAFQDRFLKRGRGNPCKLSRLRALRRANGPQWQHTLTANMTALEKSAEGIAITDAEGVFTYMNPAHAELFGYNSPDRLVGNSWRALYRAADADRIERQVFPALRANGFWRGRLVGSRADGSPVLQEVRLTLAPDNGIVCFTNDATEAVCGLRQREQLLTHTNSLWVICDPAGKAVQFNDAWVDLLGVGKEDIRSRAVFDFVHPDDAAAAAGEFVALLENGGVANFVVRMTGPEGQIHWLNWCAISGPDDGLVYATAHDITRLRLAEQSLMDNLAGIKSLSEMRTSFLSMASHELRTPLASISLAAGLIRSHPASLGAAEVDRILDGIGSEVEHMTRLLDDLFVSSRLEQLHMSVKPGPLDLAGFVELMVASLGGEFRQRVVSCLDLDAPLVLVDRSLLQHILVNLLSNACKYSAAEETVELAVVLSGRTLAITVRDRGIGIPSDQLGRIFEGFFRGRNVGRIEGTGLGLFIVRQCVALLGGQIKVSNRDCGGVEFELSVPVTVAESAPP